jgi:radical SAM superfamily enzyme YgiQ (UPF0313 family)
MTHEIPRARKIADVMKARAPGVSVVLGGAHATVRAAETLEEIPSLDFVVSGEGERPFAALLDRLERGPRDFSGIEGLAYRGAEGVHYNGPQSSFMDLTNAPAPAVDLYYHEGWFREHPRSEYRLFASRGCPMPCGYCVRVLGRRIRWREPEAVLDEWERAVRYYGARHVFVHDDLFLYDNPNTHAILDGVLARGLHREARFSSMTHVRLVDRNVLEKAARANCRKVCIGIEAGNNAILENSHRHYTIEEAHDAVREIKRAGLQPFTFFILGHPGETHGTIRDTIRAAVRLNPHEIGMGVMVPYPGTEVYELAKNHRAGYQLTGAGWEAYDRYGGRALRFDRFTRRQLVAYQVLGYVAFFVLTFKLRGMVRYFLPKLHASLRVVLGRGL